MLSTVCLRPSVRLRGRLEVTHMEQNYNHGPKGLANFGIQIRIQDFTTLGLGGVYLPRRESDLPLTLQ